MRLCVREFGFWTEEYTVKCVLDVCFCPHVLWSCTHTHVLTVEADVFLPGEGDGGVGLMYLKVHKIENFFDSDFGICIISLLVMSKYKDFTKKFF